MLDGLIITLAKVMNVKPQELQNMATQTFNNIQSVTDTLKNIQNRLDAIEQKLGGENNGPTNNG